jgi:hypothetical protein
MSLDGIVYRTASGTSRWSVELDTTLYADGSHVLAARATDSSGNVFSSTETVTVQNATAAPPAAAVPAPALAPGSLGGFAFRETYRGVYESDEQPLANQHLFLLNDAGVYLRNTYSNSAGWFAFTGLPDAAYPVQFAPESWWDLRESFVPDTTESLFPGIEVTLWGTARADFGWRPIVRATQAGSPNGVYTHYHATSNVTYLSWLDGDGELFHEYGHA